ncbi:calcineurin-like phosphoesterase [Actinomycetia phage DSL-LC01]|nr:calcineurin-like phosphoesterase [Actinomycetia phage DSL-LC01]
MSIEKDLRYEEEIEELRSALKKAQHAEYKAKRKNEDLVEAVYKAARDGSLAVGRGKSKQPPAPSKDTRKTKAESIVVHATDWQLGKKTVSYGMATCAARMDQLVEKTLHLTAIQRADHPVRDMTLMFGGDMVEGITIFPGQAWEVEAHLFEQLFEASRIMENMVRTFAENYEKVSIVCEFGNHGRLGRKGELPSGDNIDAMAYRITQDRTKDLKNVTWQMSGDWYQIVKIGNYTALLVHGDEIKSFGGNTPAFGILRKANAWATGVVEDFQDVYMGHWHTPMSLTMANGGRVFVTGSPESHNEYAREFIAAVGRPSQRVHFVDPEKGRVTAEYVVWLD